MIRFLAALVFASLGTFTFSSGQFIWLVGIASLLHQALIVRRISLAYSVGWAFCAVFVLHVWHIDFESVNSIQTNSIETLFESLRAVPLYKMKYFFTLMGSAISDSNLLLAQGAGVVMLSLVVFFSIRGFTSKDVTLLLLAWYIIICALLVTVGRSGEGVDPTWTRITVLEYALNSRYSFTSLLLAATIIVWSLPNAIAYLRESSRNFFLYVNPYECLLLGVFI